MNRLIIIGLAVFLSFESSNLWAYDGWSIGKILTIRYQSNAILISQEGASNPGNCSTTNYIYLQQDDTPFRKNMHAALLAALVSGTSPFKVKNHTTQRSA